MKDRRECRKKLWMLFLDWSRDYAKACKKEHDEVIRKCIEESRLLRELASEFWRT